MKSIQYILLIFALSISNALAQEDFETVIRKSLQKKPRPTIKLDSRNSFIASQRAKIVGLKVGADYDNVLRLGMGVNFLDSKRFKTYPLYNAELNKTDTIMARLTFYYVCVYAEYIFYRDKRWQFSIPLQVGMGNSGYKYDSLKMDRKIICLYEPSIYGHYKFFNWVGVGAGIGYRLMLKNNRAIEENFNSPTYEIGLRFFVKDLYKSIFKEKKKDKA